MSALAPFVPIISNDIEPVYFMYLGFVPHFFLQELFGNRGPCLIITFPEILDFCVSKR